MLGYIILWIAINITPVFQKSLVDQMVAANKDAGCHYTGLLYLVSKVQILGRNTLVCPTYPSIDEHFCSMVWRMTPILCLGQRKGYPTITVLQNVKYSAYNIMSVLSFFTKQGPNTIYKHTTHVISKKGDAVSIDLWICIGTTTMFCCCYCCAALN